MDFRFLYPCFVLLLLNGSLMLMVSLNSEAPDPKVVNNYTWSKKMYKNETLELKKLPLWQNYRIQSMVLLGLTVMIVGYF